METLKDYMHANSWVAVMAGCSVETALAAFERSGCVTSTDECVRAWRKRHMTPAQFGRVVIGKVHDAVNGKLRWVRKDGTVVQPEIDDEPRPRERWTPPSAEEHAKREREKVQARAAHAARVIEAYKRLGRTPPPYVQSVVAKDLA